MTPALFVVSLLVALSQSAPQALSGVVRDAVTGAPLSGAAVRIAGAGTSEAHIEVSDKDGRYRVTGLQPGRYEVSARLDGYLDARFGQARPAAPGRLVEISSSAAVADLALWQGGVITGAIVGSDGRPRSGIEVASMKRSVEFGQARLVPAGRPGRTNDRGEYRLFGLEPGRYYLLATPPIGGAAAWGTESDSFTYAPGVTDPVQATGIDVVGGTDTVVHMTLQRRRVYSLSGVVDASALSSSALTLVELRLLPTRAVRVVSAAKDGSFEARGLLPGRYKITSGGGAVSAIAEIGSTDVTGVVVGPVTKVTVRGRVLLTSGRTLRAEEIEAVRLSVVPADRDAQPALPTAATIEPNATFTLDIWPGPFVMRLVTRRSGWVITKVTRNGRDVTAGLDAAPGTTLSGIDVYVTDQAPRLRGTVRADAATAGTCAVVAFATDAKLWRTGAGTAQTATAADGTFVINSLAPGHYDVAAVAAAETLEDPAILEHLRARSTRVTLDDRATTEVSVRCVPLK